MRFCPGPENCGFPPLRNSFQCAVDPGTPRRLPALTRFILRKSVFTARSVDSNPRAAVSRYNPKESELHWQAEWESRSSFRAVNDSALPKYYVLEMFPYPSGRIHMGHVRNYTMGDVIARFRRAQGFNGLHPMGWDAFGLPAENAAREKNVHPREWTYANIAAMREQLKRMGLAIDWSREFATCDPGYYTSQQKLFLDLFQEGLV